MIGGTDIIISTKVPATVALESAVRTLRISWPDSVYENALTAERYATLEQIPFGLLNELLVYQDQQAADEWEDNVVSNTMIYLIADDKQLTLVVDDMNTFIRQIVAAITSNFVGTGD